MQWTYVTPDDGKVHYYDAAIGIPITKDGNNFEIDWSTTAKARLQGDEIYRGIASTFAPDIYDNAPAGVTLADTGTGFVVANVGGGSGEIGMRPVSFYIVFYPNTLGAALGVTILNMYAFNIKYAPYSGAISNFKLYDPTDLANAEPVADALIGNGGTNGAPVHCSFGIGDTFDNLLTNCIHVFNSAAQNTSAENKVLGDLSHDDQNYTFSVVGITQNFRPARLDVCTQAETAAGIKCGTDIEDIIHDGDSLVADAKNATANEFSSDVRSFGAIQNDSFPPGTPTGVACTAATAATDCVKSKTKYASVCDTSGDANNNTCVTAAWNHDWHGAGAIWREYGRLVQADLNAKYVADNGGNPNLVKTWHDPTCYLPQGCQGSTGATPAECAASKEMTTPNTPCTAATAMTVCTAPGATCYTDPSTATLTTLTCIVPGGGWGTGSVMEMNPMTSCTVANQATQCNQAGATCYTGATGNGLTANTCVIPLNPTDWRPAPGCTGFESLVSCAEKQGDGSAQYPTAGDDIFDNLGVWGGSGIAMKPGDPVAYFCNDPGSFNFCNVTVPTTITDLLTVSASQVLGFLGNGNVLKVPLEGRDKRYFFKQFSIAYAKYLTSPHVLDTGAKSKGAIVNGVAVNGNKVGDFSTQVIDIDNLVFDSIGVGGARSEFIDFDSADQNNDPISLEQRILILNSNLQGTNFFRKLDREERALFNTLAINPDPAQASWAYLRNPDKSFQRDTYLAYTPASPSAGTACATDTPCKAISTNASCDIDPNDANNGFCVYAFNRHNANPFLSNLAGAPALPASKWAAATDKNGNLIPAPKGWADPCNPVSTPPATCAMDSDCPGIMSCGATGTPTAGTCGPAKTAYYCATHIDGACAAGGDAPPLNDDGTMVTRENGKPLLADYCALFGQTSPYAIGGGAGITVLKTIPSEGEAFVSLPTYANPYGGGTPTGEINVMVPWLPYQEGVGYPVPNGATGGSQDVFVKTAQLSFEGQVITPIFDFFPVPGKSDPNSQDTNPPAPFGVSIQAIETQDFLGDIFVCYDATTDAERTGTGRPGDILAVHMYSSVATIIDWIAAHPGAQAACQLVIRYSPFNNFPDVVSSLANGVRLDIDQGYGFGRVVDATLFAPGSGVAPTP
jgi:hypothetical protein